MLLGEIKLDVREPLSAAAARHLLPRPVAHRLSVVSVPQPQDLVLGDTVTRPPAAGGRGNARRQHALLNQLLDGPPIKTKNFRSLAERQLGGEVELPVACHEGRTEYGWPREGLVVPEPARNRVKRVGARRLWRALFGKKAHRGLRSCCGYGSPVIRRCLARFIRLGTSLDKPTLLRYVVGSELQ